ncbi:MAG: poly(R)-hydroxyalkanoic acid synthase subunit PhaE [Candidatus Kapaibacteriota bacterium]
MKKQFTQGDFYTEWMQGQQALIARWSESAQKATDAFLKGDVSEAMKTSAEGLSNAYSSAVEQQTAMSKRMMSEAETTTQQFAAPFASSPFFGAPFNGTSLSGTPLSGMFSGNPSSVNPLQMMQEWAAWQQSMQKAMMQPWGQMFAQFAPQGNPNFFDQWTRFAEAGASSFSMLSQVAKMYEQWQHLSQSWGVSVQKMYSSMAETMPSGVAKDTFRNMFSGATVYMKLFELWMPLLDRMKAGKIPTSEEIQQALSPGKYKEVIDAVFEFMIPERMETMFAQMSAFMQSLNLSTNQASRMMMAQMEQNAKMIFGMMAHNPEAALNVYNTLMSTYQQAISSMNALPMNQRQSELAEIAQHIMGRMGEYTQTVTKFQHLLYTNGQKALEQLTESAFATGRNKKALTNFDELFKTWVETNESVFHDLFETKEYATVQSKLGQISSHLYKDFEQMFEVMLKDFPVVTRSHVDELAKTVFELKRKVRDLEKHGASMGDDDEVTVATTNKRTTSQKLVSKGASTGKSTSKKS